MPERVATPRSAVLALTTLALIAFAANSVLGRAALGSGSIEPASFTAVRLASGALVLALLLRWSRRGQATAGRAVGSWRGAAMLFLYAASFSFAYLSVDTGTGALILFGAVQLTILSVSLYRGHRPTGLEWVGLVVAVAGFVYLMLPGASAPPPGGFALMALSGIAWGFYTLIGRGSQTPLVDTARNFARTLPPAAVLLGLVVWFGGELHATPRGVALALASGGLSSAIGYAIWYRTLPSLSPTLSAVVQLLVPVLATLGGVVFVSEALTLRLVGAGVLILGGVALTIFGRGPS
jgi:drug/metabolite transporter (DMT)-like permease